MIKDDITTILDSIKNLRQSDLDDESGVIFDNLEKSIATLIESESRQRARANKLKIQKSNILNSRSYIVGHIITWPIRFIYRVPLVGKILRTGYFFIKPDRKTLFAGHTVTYGELFGAPRKPSFYLGNRKTLPQKSIKIASIMDEFTYEALSPECEVVQITPKGWCDEISQLEPDLLFIESAWRGVDGLWRDGLSRNPNAVYEVVKFCNKNSIPVVFWNKEDPAHIAEFMSIASMCDFVFTTDMECISIYRDILEHPRVYLLPFAAQPVINNPIEVYARKDKFNFAGSYYLKYKERSSNFVSIAKSVSDYKGLDIYDRNYEKHVDDKYLFPVELRKYVVGSLPYAEIDRAYKGYNYSININTIKYSSTMFARRVFELIASNTVVVSNYSKGVKNLLGDLVVASDEGSQIVDELKNLLPNEHSMRAYKLKGLREVMKNHTYDSRLSYVLSKVFVDYVDKRRRPSVCVVAVVKNKTQYKEVLIKFNKQEYTNKKLFIIFEGKEGFSVTPQTTIYSSSDGYERFINDILGFEYVAFFHTSDYYGPDYLTDMILATKFSKGHAVTKSTYYQSSKDKLSLYKDGDQYRWVNTAEYRNSVIPKSVLEEVLDSSFAPKLFSTKVPITALSVDEFNYGRGTGSPTKKQEKIINGYINVSLGTPLEKVYKDAEDIADNKRSLFKARLLGFLRLRRTKVMNNGL